MLETTLGSNYGESKMFHFRRNSNIQAQYTGAKKVSLSLSFELHAHG